MIVLEDSIWFIQRWTFSVLKFWQFNFETKKNNMLAERRSRPIIEAAKTTAASTFLSILNFVVTMYPGQELPLQINYTRYYFIYHYFSKIQYFVNILSSKPNRKKKIKPKIKATAGKRLKKRQLFFQSSLYVLSIFIRFEFELC